MARDTTGSAGAASVPPAPPGELRTSAVWPVRIGAVPPLAVRFTTRPESGPELASILTRGATVALAPRARRTGATPSHDLLRCTGKTQLAVDFAEAEWQAGRLDLLVWADGSTQASLLSAYAAAVRGLTGAPPAGSAESDAASFLRWLSRTDRRWLIVVDDVAEAGALEGLVPRGPAGRLVITTRSSDVLAGMPDVQLREVGALSPREAMSYLLRRLSTDPDQRRGAIELIEDLGYQPLALDLAAGAISTSWLTCETYRTQFYQRMTAMASPGGPPPAAAVTWMLSLDQAGHHVTTEAAEACLAIAALMDGHGTPAALFETDAARGCIGPAGPGAQAAAHATAELAALEQSGLLAIDRRAGPPLVRMNAALQQVIRHAMSPDLAERSALAAAAGLLEMWPPDCQDSPLVRQLCSCVVSLRQFAGRLLWSEGCHPVLLKAGRSLDDTMLTGPAVDYWTELAAETNEVRGSADPESLAISEQLAGAYVAAGRAPEAVSCYQRIVANWTTALGADHPRALAARMTLGRVLAGSGLFSDAISMLTAALADAERALGPGDLKCTAMRVELLAAYRAAGELTEAIRRCRQSLAERERDLGQQHPDTVAARQFLAEAYLAAGRTRVGFSLYKKVVADQQRRQGRDDPDALRAAAALAASYNRTGRTAAAAQLYAQVHAGMSRALGKDDRDTLVTAVSLGRAYHALGRSAEASALLRDTVERAERTLEPASPITSEARRSLAAIVAE